MQEAAATPIVDGTKGGGNTEKRLELLKCRKGTCTAETQPSTEKIVLAWCWLVWSRER